MERFDGGAAAERTLIWVTALGFAVMGGAALQRRAPGAFETARVQLAVEAQDLRWTVESLSFENLSRRLAAENASLAARLAPRVTVRRDDLLERTNAGLR